MSRTERNMVYIIVGMLLCFVAIFIIIAYIPSGAFDWLFKTPGESTGSTDDSRPAGSSSGGGREPERSRL